MKSIFIILHFMAYRRRKWYTLTVFSIIVALCKNVNITQLQRN